MNYYFLLEDSKSLFKVLPNWLEYMNFNCTRVSDIEAVEENNYVLQSGFGVTQLITKVLFDTIETIMYKPGKVQCLIIILDAEEEKVEDRKCEVYDKIETYRREKDYKFDFEIKVFVCNHCFESWLLANESIYPENEPLEDSFFYKYYKHYDIKNKDPELMKVPDDMDETTAKFHFHYLHEALRYKKIRYSKSNPRNISTYEYFSEIVARVCKTPHVQTFRELWEYIQGENK